MSEKDVSIQPEEPSFYEFYSEKLSPFLGLVEEKRQWYLKFYWLLIAVSVMITLSILGGFTINVLLPQVLESSLPWEECFRRFVQPHIRWIVEVLFIVWLLPSIAIFYYSKEAKVLVLDQLLRFFGAFGRSDMKISMETIQSLECFDVFNLIKQKDRFIGRYKELNVEITELRLLYESGSGRNRSVEEVFKGLLIQVDMNKKFKSKTIICKDKGLFNAMQGKSMPKVALEDKAFEKIFEVYSSDQVEARYLLTPTFMERLKRLNLSHDGVVRAAFVGQKIFIALPYDKNLFEVNLFKDAYDISQYRAILRDLRDALAVVDTLKLDQNIGL